MESASSSFVHADTGLISNFFVMALSFENAINKSNKGKSLVTLIFLSQSEVKKP